jgi:WD40 repeat protein/predicted Ser/Thr protein kinase
MNEPHHLRVRSLFAQAAELEPDERSPFLDANCRADAELRAEIEALLAYDAASGGDEDEDGFLKSPVVRPAEQAEPQSSSLPQGEEPGTPYHIGRYRILRGHGEGGMGTVYEAEQDNPRRTVALKVIRPGLVSPELVKRFQHEAQILGRLQHLGIAQVYEAGMDDAGRPFFAMEFIRGMPLDEYVRSRVFDAKARLELIAKVCDAVQHAHDKGVIHRDLKPANILVDESGQPKVLDFGVAHVTAADLLTTSSRTQPGQLLGTLSYMSPEQIAADPAAIDGRSDVYSLGVILFELLAHRLPYNLEQLPMHEVARVIHNDEPQRLGSVNTHYLGDIEIIVAKALEKEKTQRYASAGDLASDLRRHLRGEAILARKVGTVERYWRWARRNPSIAALCAVLTAVVIGVTIGAVLVARRMAALAEVNRRAADSEREAKVTAQGAQQQADAGRREADHQRERAERNLYIARMGQANGALRLFDSTTARSLLDQCRPGPGEPDRRGWEWYYLDQWCRPELTTLALPTVAESHSIAVSPDGRLMAVGCALPFTRGTNDYPPVPAYLVSLTDGKVRHELAGHKRFVYAVAFRPDGKCLATIGDEGTLLVWDVVNGRKKRAILASAPVHPGFATTAGLCFSPDGSRLASANSDGFVRIWDPETGREMARLAQKAQHLAWSPDGTRIALALAGESGLEVRPWDSRQERLSEPVLRQPGLVHSLRWSPDGRSLAAVLAERGRWWLAVLDTKRGETVFRVEQVTELGSLAFSPDGTRLAAGGKEGIVRVFDAANRRELAALFTGCMNVSGLAFSPDGRRLSAAGWGMDGIKVFDPARDPRGRSVVVHEVPVVAALTFDRWGKTVLELDWARGALTAVDPAVGPAPIDRVLPVTRSRRWPRGDFAFSRDGGLVAAPTRADASVVGVWDVASGHQVATLRRLGVPVTAVAFSPKGKFLATASASASNARPNITLWNVGSDQPVRTIEAGPDQVEALAFSDDGRKLAAGGGTRPSAPGWVTAWDADTGGALGNLGSVGLVKFLAFDPDGVRLAVADYGGAKVHIWDIAAGTQITNPGPTAVSCVGFTPDGKRLAALGYDGNVHLADSQTGEAVLVLRSFGPPPGSVGFTPRMAFSPDGSMIAANALSEAVGNRLNVWGLRPSPAAAAERKPPPVGKQ